MTEDTGRAVELERRLRRHFADRYGAPPPSAAVWGRIALRLEPRAPVRPEVRAAAWLAPWLGAPRLSAAMAALLVAVLLAGAGVAAAAQGGRLWQLIAGAPAPAAPRDRLPTDRRPVEPSYEELRPDEAARRTGFRLRLPALLPPGIDPDDATATVSHLVGTGVPLVRVAYWTVETHERGYTRRVALELSQLPAGAEPWFRPERWTTPTGEPVKATCQREAVELRPGLAALRFRCDRGAPFLTWVEDGVELQLEETGLAPEQALGIARSVR